MTKILARLRRDLFEGHLRPPEAVYEYGAAAVAATQVFVVDRLKPFLADDVSGLVALAFVLADSPTAAS